MANSIEILLKSKQTVFNTTDLAILWQIKNPDTLKSKIYYLIKNKKLQRLHQGIFALDKEFSKFELAGKLKNPSYISLETILRQENIIFQYSSEITSVSNSNKKYIINNLKYSYRQIKDSVLFNPNGIKQNNLFSIATKERAFLDMLYLNKDYYFDNTEDINWKMCQKLVKIYNNKDLISRLNLYLNKILKKNY